MLVSPPTLLLLVRIERTPPITSAEVPIRTCQYHGAMVQVMFAWVLQCMHVVSCTTTPSRFTCKTDMCIPEAIATVDAPKYIQTRQRHVSMVLACVMVH